MKHKELQDKIEGSILKKEYLEAFLVQSAYIEGLLNLLADFSYWARIVKEKDEEKNIPMVNVLRDEINRYGLYDLIEFLHKSELIDKTERKVLHNYRKKRNDILHSLIDKMGENNFEDELKAICGEGKKIVNGKKFKEMSNLVDGLEKQAKKQQESDKN